MEYEDISHSIILSTKVLVWDNKGEKDTFFPRLFLICLQISFVKWQAYISFKRNLERKIPNIPDNYIEIFTICWFGT